MKTSRHLHVMLLLSATTSWVSSPAQAALGGPNGVVIPYAGKLELDGALVTGTVDFQFGVAPNASDAAPVNCVFTLPDVPVTNGEFAVSIAIPALRESCVKGKDVHLEVRVARADQPLVFLGKQRVTPVVAAATSGDGDFAVTGALTANTAVVTGALSAGATTVAALTATSAAINGNVTVGSGNVQVNNGTVKVLSSDNNGSTNIAEFKSLNQASGVGIGFNTIRAIGSNLNESLRLEGKGTGTVVVADELMIIGDTLTFGKVTAQSLSVGVVSKSCAALSCTCAAGTALVTGGVSCNAGNAHVNESIPISTTTWRGLCEDASGNNFGADGTTIVILCAPID